MITFSLALVAALPWLIPLSFGPGTTTVQSLISMGGGLALWLLTIPQTPRPAAGLTFIAGAMCFWAWASHPSIGAQAIFLASGLALIVITASAIQNAQVARALPVGILAAAVITAAAGLCQYFGLSLLLAPWVSIAEPGAAFGNLRQTNQYATLCCLGLAVLLWPPVKLRRAVVVPMAMLLSAASAASVSRTGMLEALLITGMAAGWPGPNRRQRLHLCAAAAVAYVAATLLLPWLLEAATGVAPTRTLWGRLSGGESCSSRAVLWSNVAHLIGLMPWTGWGWGELDYAHYVTLYPGARFCDILDNAHSLPLHLAVELGLPAAAIVCAGSIWWIAARRPWAERVPERQLAWVMLAILLVHSLLEYPLWYGPFQLAFGASLGRVLASPAERRVATMKPVHAGISAAVLSAALGYATWDYWRVSQAYLPPEFRADRWKANPLDAAQGSWLFAGHARFAELTLSRLTRNNALWTYERASELLHYSPEPRIIERLIESATLLGRTEEAATELARFRAAFPNEYIAWRQANKLSPVAAQQGQD